MLRSRKRPAPSVSARKLWPLPLCSVTFAAGIGTAFSSTMTPAHSAESADKILDALIPHKSATSAASRAAQRMLYRGTADDCCAFSKTEQPRNGNRDARSGGWLAMALGAFLA